MNSLSFFNPRFTSDLFDVIDRNFSDMSNFESRAVTPRVDVIETEKDYLIQVELPGLTEDDVAIDLKNRVISISSVEKAKDKKDEKTEKKETYLVRERFSTQFTRSFTLPDDIDSENVSAKFQNGLLTITIPRKTAGEVRRIAIHPESK